MHMGFLQVVTSDQGGEFVSNSRDDFLDTCTFAYNNSPQESHYSPFQLMFGRKAKLPIHLDMALDMEKHNGDKKLRKLLENGDELTASVVEMLRNGKK